MWRTLAAPLAMRGLGETYDEQVSPVSLEQVQVLFELLAIEVARLAEPAAHLELCAHVGASGNLPATDLGVVH